MKLSIIIPVFNVDKYLRKCLDSILGQGIDQKFYEVLIINDGSTDNSQDIIEEYINSYSNVFAFYKENGGLSSARNLGIEKSKGDYLFFIDSDDFLADTILTKAIKELADDHLDCLSFNFSKVDSKENVIPVTNYYESFSTEISGIDLLNKYTVVANVWKYIFRKEIITLHNLKFTNGIYHEDEEFTVLFFLYAKRIKHINVIGYYYLKRDNSITSPGNKENDLKKINDIIYVVDSFSNAINEHKDDHLSIKGIKKKKQQLLLSIFIRMRKENFDKANRLKIMELLKEKKYYPLIYSELKLKQQICAYFLNVSPKIAYYLLKYL